MTSSSLLGWLDVSDGYDGEDNFIGTSVELYSAGRYLGHYASVLEWLRQFDGHRVLLLVEVLD